MHIVGWTRTTTAGLVLLVLGALSAVIVPEWLQKPETRLWLIEILAVSICLWFLVVLIDVRSARITRNGLAQYLMWGDELMFRKIADQAGYQQWMTDFETWEVQCAKFIDRRLSIADAMLFRDASGPNDFSYLGFSREHISHKNTLRKRIANLKAITERYLSSIGGS